MARYRKIDLRMYGDEKYRKLTPCPPCGQAMWWHLIAGEQTGIIPGIFRIGEAAFAEQLGWTLEGFREAFREPFQEGMVKADWKARLVWVPNGIKYNPPANPNVVKGWIDEWNELPECELKNEALACFREFLKGLGKGFAEPFAKPFGKSGTGTGTGTEAGTGEEDCSEPSADSEPPFLVFPCAGSPETWDLFEGKLAEYASSFPGIDVRAECRKALQWCRDNPAKIKTFRGMSAFLGRWLGKAQDQPKPRVEANGKPARMTPADIAARL